MSKLLFSNKNKTCVISELNLFPPISSFPRAQWLRWLAFDALQDNFTSNQINGMTLMDATTESLDELDVPASVSTMCVCMCVCVCVMCMFATSFLFYCLL